MNVQSRKMKWFMYCLFSLWLVLRFPQVDDASDSKRMRIFFFGTHETYVHSAYLSPRKFWCKTIILLFWFRLHFPIALSRPRVLPKLCRALCVVYLIWHLASQASSCSWFFSAGLCNFTVWCSYLHISCWNIALHRLQYSHLYDRHDCLCFAINVVIDRRRFYFS